MSKIALVTGGSRGLGRSIALNLAERGLDVVLTYRSGESEARDVVSQLEKKGRKAHALPLDATKSSTFAAFVESFAKLAPKFDVLVHNAGHAISVPMSETTEAQLDELLDVHVKAPFLLTQRLLPFLRDGGRIVNIGTGLTRFVFPGSSAYALAKGALEVLTRYQALELAPRGIIANVVAPGAIETDIAGGVLKSTEYQKAIVDQTPLGRFGQPDDIGKLVAAVASDDFGWATGQRIEATGGFRL